MSKKMYLILSLCLIACAASLRADEPATQPAGQKRTTKSGLTIVDQKPEEIAAKTGDTVYVHYTGKFQDGSKFDSSLDRHKPIKLVLGEHRVIAGWEEGLVGMKVGDKRQLIIPPNLAYGESGRGPIPANATLIFDLELVGLVPAGMQGED